MSINLTDEIDVKTKKGKLGAAKQIFLEGDTTSLQKEHEDNQAHFDTLDNRSAQMEETIKSIAATGGASQATAVTYNNDASRLNAVNAQAAIDEVSSIAHFAKRGGIVNISTNYNSDHIAEVLTLSQALSKVLSTDRVLGFQGKYLASDSWHTIIYTGDSLTSWSDRTKWIDLADKVFNSVSNNATFAGIATPATNPGTPDGPIFYFATKAGIYTNFNSISVADGEAVILQWDNGAWTKKTTGFAAEQEIIYDVSARNDGAVFESLQALLSSSNLSTLIPTSVRRGGITIRFIQGSVLNPDNKYVQYRLMSQNFTTDTTKWVIDDGGVYVESPMWIRVITDKEDRILAGIKPDGSVEWKIGIPTPVKEYVDGKLGNFASDDYDGIVTFIGNLIKSDKTLQNLLDEKVISETGKSLIDEGYADSVEHVEHHKYADVKIDSNGRMLEAIEKDGSKVFYVNVSSEKNIQGALVYDKLENKTIIDYNDFAKAYLINDVLVYAIKRDGTLLIPKIENKVLNDRFFGRTVIASNKPSMMESLLLQSLYSLNKDGNDKFVRNTTLLQFSDVHGSLESLKNIQTFYDLYSKYITDIFHNGDIIQNTYDTSDYTFWNNVDISKKILNCIGNHDTCNGDKSDWQYYSGRAAYDRYFADYISQWGVNYTSGNCYYYKDYSNCLRFIVLDENLKDYEDELSWLEGVLDDALTNNYHVVIATHSTQGSINVKAQFKNNTSIFSRLDEYVGNMYDFRGASDLVESFVNKGGKFCCWLVGHAHCTDLGYNDLYPNRLIIAADIVSPTRFSKDIEKSEGNNTECSFNIVSFDTSATLIKIIKVGANYDKFYRNRNTLVYNYTSNEIISEN